MILFLDFDGVLHPDPCLLQQELFCRLPHLESVLRDFPLVDIVISSAWRETRTLAELRMFFSRDIRKRVIDMTPCWRNLPDLMAAIRYERHAEIDAWLCQSGRSREAWIAIDDRPYLFEPWLPNLVCSDPLTGLDRAVENQLRDRFNRAAK